MSYRVGEVIAQRYQVVNLIGTGSGGEVYKIWDKMRSTHLALKLLKPEWNSNPQLVSNFLEEAKSLSNLQHPHIVRFYELVDTGDSAFFLMDYVDGVTLRKVIKRSNGPLPLK
ncbi:MAG: protein kinase, partial [Candidatus Cloacimonetes bacterium]|nr:protein kinase [Candidatus Cloacimonadota bacterium]